MVSHSNLIDINLQVCLEFSEFAGFRGIIGAIDGCHIKIARPWVDEKIYVNRKNFHSINVQVSPTLFKNMIRKPSYISNDYLGYL